MRDARGRISRRTAWHRLTCVAFTFVALFGLPSRSISNSKSTRLLIVVLTAQRHESFSRLFHSLLRANYSETVVDILIHIDGVDANHSLHEHTVKLAQSAMWPHGRKVVEVEKEKIGLRRSWLSVSPRPAHTHVAIFEDDMEVSSQFYNFFTYVHNSNFFSRSTALCLHPSDWELRVIAERKCEPHEMPDIQFYFTPEPCNWAPVWSSAAWCHFKRWALHRIAKNINPFTPAEVGFNYNEYLKMGKDVQSPWVWRYNWEHGQVQLRYTVTCFGDPRGHKYHMAVNHREPGNNFISHAPQEHHDYLTSLLVTVPLVNSTEQPTAYRPIEFKGYEGVSLRLPPP